MAALLKENLKVLLLNFPNQKEVILCPRRLTIPHLAKTKNHLEGFSIRVDLEALPDRGLALERIRIY